LEVAEENSAALHEALEGTRYEVIGEVTSEPRLKIRFGGETAMDESTIDLRESWRSPLNW
jgi:hypothetical protein